ncbi:MAG: hypothetical protein KKB50_07840 [Planctomycetes bacterium]|nr:hypothetical protein [Planctomycetota bacterium]
MLLALLCAAAAAQPADHQPPDPQLARLVEQITRGDEDEAKDAADLLIERVIGPVAAALGSIEARPTAEQQRLRRVLARLNAALRIRLVRLDLPEAERKLLDEFAAHYPELVERLFDDDWRRRLAAVQQIPVEPGTGASVLVVLKVNDADADVAEAALDSAAALADEVVVRGLTRFVHDATEALRTGYYGPHEQDVAMVVSLYIARSIEILGQTKASASVPVIVAATRYLARSPYGVVFDLPKAADALAQIGEEEAVPVLLEFLGQRRVHVHQRVDRKTLLTQTEGDAVLLSILRIYRLPPEQFGLQTGPPPQSVAGFPDHAAQQAGHEAFLRWHEENAHKPRAARQVSSSRPARRE